jgi:hypothetical protein
MCRGFIVDPAEMDSMDEEAKSDLSDRLRYLLAALGEEYTLQCRYMVCSDYSEVLDNYKSATEGIADKRKHRWQVWNRTERHTRYLEAMREGPLSGTIRRSLFRRTACSETSCSRR